MQKAKKNSHVSNLIDPSTLMRIKSLEMRARVVVEGFLNGLHRSPFHGFSVEFSEYREYSPGDDPRYLDWRLFARSDRYYVKRFEDETSLCCHLLVDMSRSMGFGSGEYTKAEYARTVAATLAYFLAGQRDSVGLMLFDETITEYIPPRYRPGHMHRLMVGLERAVSGADTDLTVPIDKIAQLVTKRGVIVMISDLLAPIDSLETHLGYLRSRGHEVIILRVLDPAEVSFDFDRPAMFRDAETGRQIYVDPESVRAEYSERFNRHSSAVERVCGDLGIDLWQFNTDRSLELALFDFVNSRGRRGREVAKNYAGTRKQTARTAK